MGGRFLAFLVCHCHSHAVEELAKCEVVGNCGLIQASVRLGDHIRQEAFGTHQHSQSKEVAAKSEGRQASTGVLPIHSLTQGRQCH